MDIENDILEMIRDIPQEMNDFGTTTEFKFLTVGALLWQCYHEIKNLRAENRKLKERKK